MAVWLEVPDTYPSKRADIDAVLVRFGYPVPENYARFPYGSISSNALNTSPAHASMSGQGGVDAGERADI